MAGPDVPGRTREAPRWMPELGLPLLGVVLVAFNLRAALSVTPPLLGQLERHHGFSQMQASALGSLPPLAFAVAGFAGLSVMRRLGLERTAWVAMGLAALGQVGRVLLPDPVSFLLLSAVALVGLGLGNVVVPPLVKRHFPGQVALVTGAYVVVLQAGTAVAAQSAVPVANAAGLDSSLGVWSVIALVAMVPWLLVGARRSGPDLDLAGPRQHLPLRLVARAPLAWGMVLLFGMQSLTAYAVITWLPTLYLDAGLTESAGGTALAVFAVCQVPMSLFAPILVNRVRRPFLLVVAFAAGYAAAYLGLALTPVVLPMLWAALLGLGAGSFPLALALIGLRVESPAGAASLSSFAQGLGYLLAITGPLIFGHLGARYGWHVSLAFTGILLVPLLIGGWLVARPRTLESEVRVAREESSYSDRSADD